jgi:hypothetical protein
MADKNDDLKIVLGSMTFGDKGALSQLTLVFLQSPLQGTGVKHGCGNDYIPDADELAKIVPGLGRS